MRYLAYPIILILLLTGLPQPAVQAAPAAADFGSGLSACPSPPSPVLLQNPHVVSGAQCTRAGIQSALDAGGHILLECGSVPIPIDQTLTLNPSRDTVLDGGGTVTLDGLGLNRILIKNWHDPKKTPSVTITLQNIRLINGKAPAGADTGVGSGGAVQAGHPGTRLHIIRSTFEGNSTRSQDQPDNQGGAIFAHNAYELLISESVFVNNSAGNGGAVGIIAAGLRIYNSQFTANRASDSSAGGIVRGYGGAVAVDGVENSYNPDSSGQLSVCGSVFDGNTAYRGGGAFDSVVSDGLGTWVVFQRSTFVNNRVIGIPLESDASQCGGQGGAIYHIEDDHAGASGELNLSVIDTTFSNNQACMQGGALWVSILGRGVISNVTFNGNSTSAPLNKIGQGGAAALSLGTFLIQNSTFANNHAAYQGGALHGGGTSNAITLSNTIFYNNTLNNQTQPSDTKWQGYHTSRTLLDGGQNIQYPRFPPGVTQDTNHNRITANPIFADPLLGSLGDYGGPNQTLPLLAGSPGIDQGGPAGCPPYDQRGFARVGPCDIGAFEYDAELPGPPAARLFLPLIE